MQFLKSDEKYNSFEEMNLLPSQYDFLKQVHIEQPTSIQQFALKVAFSGKDLMAVAQTGSGKTLVYVLSILTQLEKNPTSRALVLTPSRETADQIFNIFTQALSPTKVTPCLVVAGLPDRKLVSQLNKLPRVIVATPGRLVDQLSSNKLLLQKLSTQNQK